MEVSDRISLKLLALGLALIGYRQSADPVALQTGVQERACQSRYRLLQGVKAVIQRKQCLLPEGEDNRFPLYRQHRRFGIFGAVRNVFNRRPLVTALRALP
jgi:hypothetical protein